MGNDFQSKVKDLQLFRRCTLLTTVHVQESTLNCVRETIVKRSSGIATTIGFIERANVTRNEECRQALNPQGLLQGQGAKQIASVGQPARMQGKTITK
eukprot:scaffold161010_cov14-Tisochrysis_lutea.AAC.1